MLNKILDSTSSDFELNVIHTYTSIIPQKDENNIPNYAHYLDAQMASAVKLQKEKLADKYWKMLLDACFFKQDRSRFERVASLYSEAKHKLAPIWYEKTASSVNYVNNVLKISTLSVISESKIKDFIAGVTRGEPSHIDFASTQFTNENLNVVAILDNLLQTIKGEDYQIVGTMNISNFLEEKILDEQCDPVYFRLLLSIYQWLGKEQEYNDLALRYLERYWETVDEYRDKYVAKKESGHLYLIDDLFQHEVFNEEDMTFLIHDIFEKCQNKTGEEVVYNFENVQFIPYGALESLQNMILNNQEMLEQNRVVFDHLRQILYSSMEIMGIDKNLIVLKLKEYTKNGN